MARTVADDPHTVAEICEFGKAVNVLIDYYQIMAFFSQTVYKGIADFSGADYDNFQSSFTHRSNTK